MAEGPRPLSGPARPVVLQGRLVSRRPLGPTTFWLEWECASPSPAALPGQFFMVRLLEGWPALLARPFSLASWREGGRRLGFLVEEVGRGSGALARAGIGGEALLWGPLGKAFPSPEGAVLLAGGVGLAPFLLALERDPGAPRLVLFGGRDSRRLAPASLVPEGAPLELATDDGSRGYAGTVVALLEEFLRRGRVPAGTLLQVCGPEPMMAAAAALAEREGLPCLVSLETRMGCGVGICAGCAVDLRPGAEGYGGMEKVLACKAGPVFPSRDLAWKRE